MLVYTTKDAGVRLSTKGGNFYISVNNSSIARFPLLDVYDMVIDAVAKSKVDGAGMRRRQLEAKCSKAVVNFMLGSIQTIDEHKGD